MRWLLTVVCLSFASLALGGLTSTLDGKVVDKLLVLKSEHRLLLLSHDRTLKAYRISLGKRPKGPKIQEGDKRTPEGFYRIDWRKTSDRYGLAMHISYPNARDQDRAAELKVEPGGMIMLHGTPSDEEYPEWYFHTLDWTEGCIALTNADMREVWTLVRDGTLIEIRP